VNAKRGPTRGVTNERMIDKSLKGE